MTQIEARFVFGEAAMKEAYRMHRSLRRWPKVIFVFSVLVAGWGAWLLVSEQRFWPGGALLVSALLTIGMPYLNRAIWLRAIRENPFYDREVQCIFNTNEFIMVADGKGLRVPWAETFKIVEGRTGYLVYPKIGAFYYVPNSAFATEIDAQRVKGVFLAEKMQRA